MNVTGQAGHWTGRGVMNITGQAGHWTGKSELYKILNRPGQWSDPITANWTLRLRATSLRRFESTRSFETPEVLV
jgi:hypothetical protein